MYCAKLGMHGNSSARIAQKMPGGPAHAVLAAVWNFWCCGVAWTSKPIQCLHVSLKTLRTSHDARLIYQIDGLTHSMNCCTTLLRQAIVLHPRFSAYSLVCTYRPDKSTAFSANALLRTALIAELDLRTVFPSLTDKWLLVSKFDMSSEDFFEIIIIVIISKKSSLQVSKLSFPWLVLWEWQLLCCWMALQHQEIRIKCKELPGTCVCPQKILWWQRIVPAMWYKTVAKFIFGVALFLLSDWINSWTLMFREAIQTRLNAMNVWYHTFRGCIL